MDNLYWLAHASICDLQMTDNIVLQEPVLISVRTLFVSFARISNESEIWSIYTVGLAP